MLGMRELAVQLTDQQADFVRFIVSGGRSPEEAGSLCGYHPKSVYRVLKMPAVAHAIHEAIAHDIIAVGAPAAYRVAKHLMLDPNVSARVRADISFKILDRAGYIVPSNRQRAPDKALSEMTQAELLAFIERNQAEIDKAEGELAAAAKDVSAPVSAPKAQAIDAKSLNYLD